jgi:hypothetical protein
MSPAGRHQLSSPATGRAHEAGALEREQLFARLQNLRATLPVFAQELAGARRQAGRLRLENGRLREQVRELQIRRAERNPASGAAPGASRRRVTGFASAAGRRAPLHARNRVDDRKHTDPLAGIG